MLKIVVLPLAGLLLAVAAWAADVVVVADWSKYPVGTKGIPEGWKGGDWGSPKYDFRIAEADGLFYVEDVQRQQLGPAGVDGLMRTTAELDGKNVAQREEKEGGSAGGAVVAARAKTLVGFDYNFVQITGSKVTRSKPFRAQCEAGNVRIVRGAWNADYIKELCAFPTAKHDDQVDGSSCAFNAVLLEPEPFRYEEAGMTSAATW